MSPDDKARLQRHDEVIDAVGDLLCSLGEAAYAMPALATIAAVTILSLGLPAEADQRCLDLHMQGVRKKMAHGRTWRSAALRRQGSDA